MRPYAVAFIAEKGRRYRLVYGDPSITSAPIYEQRLVKYLNEGRDALQWSLTDAETGAVSYGASVRARQFLARHGMLLISLLVMVALGLLILRAAKMPTK